MFPLPPLSAAFSHTFNQYDPFQSPRLRKTTPLCLLWRKPYSYPTSLAGCKCIVLCVFVCLCVCLVQSWGLDQRAACFADPAQIWFTVTQLGWQSVRWEKKNVSQTYGNMVLGAAAKAKPMPISSTHNSVQCVCVYLCISLCYPHPKPQQFFSAKATHCACLLLCGHTHTHTHTHTEGGSTVSIIDVNQISSSVKTLWCFISPKVSMKST